MKRVAFFTLGCKVNQYETGAMSEIFENEGYQVVDFDTMAEVYVINTCTVTGMSDRKSRNVIRKAKKNNPQSFVIVVGCYAQTSPEEVERIPGVNMVVGTKDKGKIIEFLEEIKSGSSKINYVDDIKCFSKFEKLDVTSYKERTRAILKIQDGCNNYCSYCIIPYARGPIRSRNREDVINEVKGLAQNGFKEIVLTGIHLASYGRDIGYSLLEIIKDIHDFDGIERIRLGSIEPNIVSLEFVEEVKNLRKLCPHFHISLQSGCDETLKRMNRKYTTVDYANVVKLLRDNIPDVSITTDIMVGFPGETDIEFNQTLGFLEEIALTKMHVFKYSPRKGTVAATFKDQVTPDKKEERSSILLKLSDRNLHKFNMRMVGRTVQVLFEQEFDLLSGYVEGLTMNFSRVVSRGGSNTKGKILDVKLVEAKEDYILGNILNA
ncbi:tRNA (N(6)-L-threonylcarbamoyladenosine(37)-C(2))-methylthiotransferase MtaB [Pseudobacteroides cellulosolvens]|uniref:Threonylcarbamoyladenosine tRNA methylthiotransferase MtaB n=1 Tax=Pseudobacteroides cellulosolvens ATCC 35603 = DSM 2933 TaxID=398512 RepID=A0A0L6JRZ2_9FIRM|nr:tRNA (N(6)-L-threonylcarbamoyladenosine(37)-C(2))-methylthiotransferase MtaB [Pseudobacteroides cellulosolvens]KNY28470.1 MiaB-like tRNA modifying enzyme [Pseudobacteroides cellulosolvens ATCC 35603 = DSM 2933]